MSKGTIIYVGGFELPDKNAAAHRVISNGKIFKKLGYNVVFIGTDKLKKYDSNFLNDMKIYQGFDSYSVAYPLKTYQWLSYLTSIKHIEYILEKYNDTKMIVAYNYPAVQLARLIKFTRQNNIKLISDCTEWYNTIGENIIFRLIKGTDSFLRMRVLQKWVDGVIAISKYLDEYYYSFTETIRIPPLVDLDEKKWELKNREIDDKVITFIYSGSPGKNKDKLNIIINEFHKINDKYSFKFIITGISKNDYLSCYPTTQQQVLDMGDKIIFLGRVSHLESLELLKSSDYSIFIRESNRTNIAGFPTKFVESISCGTTVITNAVGDVSDYACEYKELVILTDNLEAELTKIFTHDGKMNIKRNINIFDHNNYIDAYCEFLERIGLRVEISTEVDKI